MIIYSVSFQKFVDWMAKDRWNEITEEIIRDVQNLAAAGADFALIATNTMHLVFDKVEEASPIPLISIVDATAESIRKEKINAVSLFCGLHYGIDFYREGLARYGIEALVPKTLCRE